MKEIHRRVWELAKPFYKSGRPTDMEHVEWMIDQSAIVCVEENLQDALLLPLVILHDVGYGSISSTDYFNRDARIKHMEEGAKIAASILAELSFPSDELRKIIHYVSVHDNWAIGDDELYRGDLTLGVFNDLDFTWMASAKGFRYVAQILRMDSCQMLEYLENNEKLTRRPFSVRTTERIFRNELSKRRGEI